MKEFKGTPGPWQIGSECISGDIRITNDDSSMVAIAEAKTGDGFLWSTLTIECNASLIAAAPDLLEALQWIQMALNRGTSMDVGIAQEKANAAIARALGEKQ